jgi:hypothetical protein
MYHINEDIANAFIEYYTNLFTTSNVGNLGECIHVIDSEVSSDMNVQLLTEFTMEEINQSLGQMQAFKAPGPDDFVACFYQQNWAIVGTEVCQAVLSFLNTGQMVAKINETNIALKNPSQVSDFRPINLCNIIYKLISKVLANRLKVVLPHIISYN